MALESNSKAEFAIAGKLDEHLGTLSTGKFCMLFPDAKMALSCAVGGRTDTTDSERWEFVSAGSASACLTKARVGKLEKGVACFDKLGAGIDRCWQVMRIFVMPRRLAEYDSPVVA